MVWNLERHVRNPHLGQRASSAQDAAAICLGQRPLAECNIGGLSIRERLRYQDRFQRLVLIRNENDADALADVGATGHPPHTYILRNWVEPLGQDLQVLVRIKDTLRDSS